jgi:hypothetical protein
MCRYWARVLLEQEGFPHSCLGGASKAGLRQAAFGADESEAKPVVLSLSEGLGGIGMAAPRLADHYEVTNDGAGAKTQKRHRCNLQRAE